MDEPVGGVLSHAALFYYSQPEYAERITAFVRVGLDRGEPALIALPGDRAPMIGASLDGAVGEVTFADMAELGRNPARIIPEVRSFTDKHPGQPVRFVGEPIWLGRTGTEICEATRHEALLNLAFARAEATILCPYDASGLAASVLASARCTHQEPGASGATAATWRTTCPRNATSRSGRRPRRRRPFATKWTWRRCAGWSGGLPGAPDSARSARSTWSWPRTRSPRTRSVHTDRGGVIQRLAHRRGDRLPGPRHRADHRSAGRPDPAWPRRSRPWPMAGQPGL